MQSAILLDVRDYTVAVVCPLAIELTAVRCMLDVHHQTPRLNTSDDDNSYTCGSIGEHNLVVASLPQWHNGPVSASTLINSLRQSFHNVQVTFLVGIGGALPAEGSSLAVGENVVLGDVVIGWDGDKTQAVVNWNETGHWRILPPPNRRILNVLTKMQSNQHLSQVSFYQHLKRATDGRHDGINFTFPGRGRDLLHEASYSHVASSSVYACGSCDPRRLVDREPRKTDDFKLHFGTIACVESVVTTTETRNRIRDETKALCVEMEAAGILERHQCLVIRGISDYADTHKNDVWKAYASATAAAVAREIVLTMDPGAMNTSPSTSNTMNTSAPIIRNKYYSIPRDPTVLFTGRRTLLDRMRDCLLPTTTTPVRGQKRFVLHGLGGSGKTELCLKFAEDNRERFWGIFMIDASSQQSIERDLAIVAKDCEIEEDVDKVKRSLSNSEGLWLLIFDNADESGLDLRKYFPVGSRGMVIVASRDSSARRYQTVGFEELGPMDMEDAVTLLLRDIGSLDNGIDEEAQQTLAQTIVSSLGCHAIAIDQAAATIRVLQGGMEEYIQIQRRQHEREPLNSSTKQDYDEAYMSMEVSLQTMTEALGNAGEDAVELLQIFSFFHYNGIPGQILEQSIHGSATVEEHAPLSTFQRKLINRKHAIKQAKPYDWNPLRFKKAATALSSFSLIKHDKYQQISVHPLLHSWARERSESGMTERSWIMAVHLLGASIAWNFEAEDYRHRRWILPHIQRCLEQTYSTKLFQINNSSREWLSIIEKLALAYAESGQTNEAIELTRRLLITRRRVLGPSDVETLRAINSLSNYYRSTGNREEALRLLKQAVPLKRDALGELHPDTLSAWYSLAIHYGDVGDSKEAVRLLEDVLQTQKVTLGSNHPDVLRSMNSLSVYYGNADRFNEAFRLAEAVLTARINTLGAEHPDTLTTLNNIATWQWKRGYQEEALDAMGRVVQLRKRILSREHPDTLRSMNRLAVYNGKIGRMEEAIEIMRSVVEGRRKILGPSHPDTLESINILAVLRKSMQEIGC